MDDEKVNNFKINNQEEILNYLIKTVKELKNENMELKKRLINLENWKKEFEENQIEKDKQNFNSKIMNKKEQINLIKNKFKKRGLTIKKLNLLFSSSEEGDSSQIVHNKIDGKENILMLVKTTKGRKFGGYTNIGFDSSQSTKEDNEAFLFSLDKLKTYDNIKEENAIFCSKDTVPFFYSNFGNYNIKIENKFFSKDGYTTKKGDCYETTEDYEINGGEERFVVKELEFFQIIF